MSMQITYWEYPKVRRTPDDYDAIETIRMKSVAEVPILVINKPERCRMITLEHSSARKLKNGKMTDFQKILWEYPNPVPTKF